MKTDAEDDLVRWFGDDGARVVRRALERALRRAKAEGQRAMMANSAPSLRFSDGRRALVRATLLASAATKREVAHNRHGRSFHFQLRHVTGGARGGKAVAHEAYIERESATEKLGAEAESHQPYLEDEEKVESADRRSAFGTIGDTIEDRQRFWSALANSLEPRFRVQHRIIASLPHELSPAARQRAVEAFCLDTFAARGIPFFAALHAPTSQNDDRNFHVHIVFAARPARQINGMWDFELGRPQGQNRQMRAELQNIPVLRRRFAAHVNEQIKREGAGLPFNPGKVVKRAKHHLVRTPKVLLRKEPALEKAHVHVRRVFENEVIETQRQLEVSSNRDAGGKAHSIPRLVAAGWQPKRLRRSEGYIERAVGAMERAQAEAAATMAVERTVVSVVDRAKDACSQEEAALLSLMRAELARDLEEAENTLRFERRRFARRLKKIGRQMRHVANPERRLVQAQMQGPAVDNQLTHREASQRPSRPSQPTGRPSSAKSGGRNNDPLSL